MLDAKAGVKENKLASYYLAFLNLWISLPVW
jgi:hypothetical protein